MRRMEQMLHRCRPRNLIKKVVQCIRPFSVVLLLFVVIAPRAEGLGPKGARAEASEAKQSPVITCFLFLWARAAGICSMPHITALHGGNVGPAPFMAPISQTPAAHRPSHLHILPQKSLKKDIDPLNFV